MAYNKQTAVSDVRLRYEKCVTAEESVVLKAKSNYKQIMMLQC
jgi:hypothetical protein